MNIYRNSLLKVFDEGIVKLLIVEAHILHVSQLTPQAIALFLAIF
jgi:hypothetical protein